ncbi:hypothetical protein EHQ97_14670 [Leptospira adleri]|nr:hypothetical protein EHQ97_14670 [Leptospira adleri]
MYAADLADYFFDCGFVSRNKLTKVFGFDPPYVLFFGGILIQFYSILILFSSLSLFLTALILPLFRSKLQKLGL